MKLSVQDLNSFYGPAHILFDIALDVGEGEVVALLGRNGAGKSTTFRHDNVVEITYKSQKHLVSKTRSRN